MRSLIVFSFFIAAVCAASLSTTTSTTSTPTTTIKASLSPDVTKVEKISVEEHATEHEVSAATANEVVEANKTTEDAGIVQKVIDTASNIGTKTLDAIKSVISSDESKEANSSANVTIKTEETKTVEVVSVAKENAEKVSSESTSHSANHVHTRQTENLFGAESGLIQNGGLYSVNNGIGNGGTVRSERVYSTNNGGIVRTENYASNSRLLQPETVVYNQGLSSSGGLLSSGKVISSGGSLGSGQILSTGGNVGIGGSLSSGQVLKSGSSYGIGGSLSSGQILNSGSNLGIGSQTYNSGGVIRSGSVGSGNIVQTGQLLSPGLQQASNNVLVSNYQSQNLGNTAEASKQIVLGLDDLNSVPQTVEYSKQFYHFEAPEEYHESGQVSKQLSNVLKKNLQVIFINAPENAATTNAAIQLAKQAIEQKTAIYILSKEADAPQLIGQLEQIQENIQTKPEVKIIKYRTLEDLERAKLEIQSQYEATGGSTESFNGGIVPVLNYASEAEASKSIGSLLGSGIVSSGHLGGLHHAESSNVVSSVGTSAPIVGQVNVIKTSNTGASSIGGSSLLNSGNNAYTTNSGLSGSGSLITNSVGTGSLLGSNLGSSSSIGSGLTSSSTTFGSNTGSSKYFGSGSLINPLNSQGSTTVTKTNTVYTREEGSNSVAGPISKFPANSDVYLKTTTTSGNLGSGNSALVNAYNVGSNDGFGSSSSRSTYSEFSSGPLVGAGSGISNVIADSSSKLTGSNLGLSKVVEKGSSSSQTIVSGSSTSSNNGGSGSGSSLFGTGSSSTLGSGSLQTSSPGSTVTVSSYETKTTKTVNSAPTGSNVIFGTGSTSGSGNSGSFSSFGTQSSKTTNTGIGAGNYASHVTIDSSKISGSGSGINDGVSVLSSTQIGHGQSGSNDVKNGEYYASSSERSIAIDTKSPSVHQQYLPPIVKKK